MVQHWPPTQEHVVRFVHPTMKSGFPLFLDLKPAYISTLPEIILLVSTQTYINLSGCKVGQIPVSEP